MAATGRRRDGHPGPRARQGTHRLHPVDDGHPGNDTDLAPGQTLPGTVQGPLSLCATSDGQVLPLPCGTYEACAVVEAFTFGARPAENPGNLIGAYSIVSNPVEFTVG